MQIARDVDPQLADKFVGMYVNERNPGLRTGRARGGASPPGHGHKAGIIPRKREWIS